jgi:crotonobetainyl-CoA:carnitine CoA-transferase CaiB-like acyl-CoA transferase
VPHPELGSVPFQGPAVRLHGTPATIRSGAPALGEHTEDVLRDWLGYRDADIEDLRMENAI